MNKAPHYLAETIAEVTNIKILEIYRTWHNDFLGEARRFDGHLRDLSIRIVDAISEVPEPDEYETWLREKAQGQQQFIDDCIKTPDPGRSPIDGDEPDTYPALFKDLCMPSAASAPFDDMAKSNAKWINEVLPELGTGQPEETESNETPATADQQQAKSPGGDNVPEPADCGAEPGTPEPDQRHPIVAEIEAYMANNGITAWKAAEAFGLSGMMVSRYLSGKSTPFKSTVEKIRAVIKKTKKKTKLTAVDPEPVKQNGAGRGPGDYMRLKLLAWLNQEHLGLSQASSRLMVQESALRRITIDGEIPHSNVVRQLCKYVPAIAAERAMLMDAARRQESNGQGGAN